MRTRASGSRQSRPSPAGWSSRRSRRMRAGAETPSSRGSSWPRSGRSGAAGSGRRARDHGRATIPPGRVDVPRLRHRVLGHRALSAARGLPGARPAALLVRRRRADRRGLPPAPLPPAPVVRALGALAARPRPDPGGPGRGSRALRRAPRARRRRVDAHADLRGRGAAEPGRRLADGARRRRDRRDAGARGVVLRRRRMKKYKDIAGDGGSNIVAQVEAQQRRPWDSARLQWNAVTQDEAHTWRGSMEASALREFLTDTNWGELDLLLLDLPPGTDRLLTIAGLVERLAGTVVVTIPSDVSHLVVRKAITVASQVKAPVLGLVENMAGLLSGPDAALLARDAGIPLLGRVPFDPALAAAADRGEPFVAVAPESAAARALVAVAAEIQARITAPAA